VDAQETKALLDLVQREWIEQHRKPVVDQMTQEMGPFFGLMFNLDRPAFEAIVSARIAERINRN
jgi:hypothetical protein